MQMPFVIHKASITLVVNSINTLIMLKSLCYLNCVGLVYVTV